MHRISTESKDWFEILINGCSPFFGGSKYCRSDYSPCQIQRAKAILEFFEAIALLLMNLPILIPISPA